MNMTLRELSYAGPEQTCKVSEMLAQAFDKIERREDMFGVERFVTAIKKAL